MYKSTVLLIALMIAMVATPSVWGQVPETQPGSKTTTASQLERPMIEFFAAKMVLCNNSQIEMSNFALTKASNTEVKQFAEMLAREHAAANQQLKPFVPDYAAEPITAAKQASSTSPPATQTAQQPGSTQKPGSTQREQKETSFRAEGPAATLRQLYDICEMAHKNFKEDCREQLMKLSGSEFDKAYLIGQVGGHSMALAELEALETHTSGEFQKVVRQAKTNVEEHLKSAERICKSLDSDSDSN